MRPESKVELLQSSIVLLNWNLRLIAIMISPHKLTA